MPELPEVETIAQGLSPGLIARVFTDARPLSPSIAHEPKSWKAFAEKLAGRRILNVRRRAKLLLVDLGPRPDLENDPDAHLAFHLKMTGRLFINDATTPPDKHVRLVLPMDDGQALFFQDMRRFGACRLLTPKELAAWPFFANLGPEPMDVSPEGFDALLAPRKGRIKALLLNQTVIAGIGNIYADEALFLAGIRPDADAASLASSQRRKLMNAIHHVLAAALAAGGSTIRDYRTAQGLEGAFQHNFNAYGRAGQPCPRCGAVMRSAKVAARTSTFCPNCQD